MEFPKAIIIICLALTIAVAPLVSSAGSGQQTSLSKSPWFSTGSMERYSISINNSGAKYEGSLNIQIVEAFENGTYNWTGGTYDWIGTSSNVPYGSYREPQFYPGLMMGPFQAVNSSVLSAYNNNNLDAGLYGLSIYNLFRGYDYGNASEIYSGYVYNTTMGSFNTDKVVIDEPNVSIQSYIDKKSGILVAFNYRHWYNGTMYYYFLNASLIGTNVNTTLTPHNVGHGLFGTLFEVIFGSTVSLAIILPAAWIILRKRAGRK